MKYIRIPLGLTDKDRDKFVKDFIRVFPDNTKEKAEDLWQRNVDIGTLQIILDLETGVTTHVQKISKDGVTRWELSSRFINNIPLIENYDPNKEVFANPILNNSNKKGFKISYNIDDLLDIISEKGYDGLTAEQKDFLAKTNKK